MPATYEPIATTTLGTAASTITFSSIPATYTDLRVVLAGTASASVSPEMRFNSDTGSNYSLTTLQGNGASASSSSASNQTRIYLGYDSSMSTTVPTMFTADIFSYAGSTNKTALATGTADKNGSGNVERIVGLWRNTSAITTVAVLVTSQTFSVGTTATLYGILKA